MNISYHTLHWDNVDLKILESHNKVMNHFNIPIQYMDMNIDHGTWMTSIIRNTLSDVYVFFDIILDTYMLSYDINNSSIRIILNNDGYFIKI